MDFLKELNSDTIGALLLYVAPGFISLRIWRFLHPGQKTHLAESLIEAVIYSSWNYIIAVVFVLRFTDRVEILYGICFIVFPILWPVGFHYISKIKRVRNRITPTSWDYFFNQGTACFILAHMKNGKMLGGLYGGGSFTSSYPEPADIYLEEVWRIDDAGRFLEKIDRTAGLLVRFEEIDYLEFFAVDGDDTNENEGESNAEA
jgi:hypothetical protein